MIFLEEDGQMDYEFQKSIQRFDLFEESKTYSNGNLLLLPKVQRLYCMSYEQ